MGNECRRIEVKSNSYPSRAIKGAHCKLRSSRLDLIRYLGHFLAFTETMPSVSVVSEFGGFSSSFRPYAYRADSTQTLSSKGDARTMTTTRIRKILECSGTILPLHLLCKTLYCPHSRVKDLLRREDVLYHRLAHFQRC